MILELKDIHTYYGTSHVLFGVSLDVRRGEVVCLMGRNGAGKSTTFRSIMGITPPRRGIVLFRGKDVTRLKVHARARLGIGYVPEDRQIFPDLTVRENLEIGRSSGIRRDGGWDIDRIYSLFPVLEKYDRKAGGQLSGGEQQMLTIARTLMTNPEVLLLDEPSEGLAPLVVAMLAEMILRIRGEGVTVLLAEQNLHFCAKVSDRAFVIDKGAVKYEGTMKELLADEEIKEKYLAV